MSDLVRFTVSLEQELLEEFDRFCSVNHLATRSEAIRQLIREKLTFSAWEQKEGIIAASLTLVYDHHKTKLNDKMLEIQHSHAQLVVATMHIHLDHDLCLEVITLRGEAKSLADLAATLSGLKGIHQAQLVVARSEVEGHQHQDHSH